MAKIPKTKYIVRQPIKDLKGSILGYEIRYTGESQRSNITIPPSSRPTSPPEWWWASWPSRSPSRLPSPAA